MVMLGIDIGGTSVKTALLRDRVLQTGRSAEFARPSLETLLGALRSALPADIGRPTSVGLCVPGLLDQSGSRVLHSINVPALQELPLAELIKKVIGGENPSPNVFSDTHAAAYGFWWDSKPSGRLLAIALGTGVGASVLDDGIVLRSTGAGCGHFGQIDVSLDQRAPIAIDGSRGSLESYIGVAGLFHELGPDFAQQLGTLDSESVIVRALARAIRIGHAIYRPDTIALLGYVGMKLAPCADAIRVAVDLNLTSVAKKDWKLAFADSPFLAAIGAARLAAQKQ